MESATPIDDTITATIDAEIAHKTLHHNSCKPSIKRYLEQHPDTRKATNHSNHEKHRDERNQKKRHQYAAKRRANSIYNVCYLSADVAEAIGA